MKFYFHQVWNEDGREYGHRLDFKDVTQARRAHVSAADFMWSKPTYTREAITALTWQDDGRMASIQQGTTRKYKIDVTAEPTQTPCPQAVKQQIAKLIRGTDV
jgi:hypothetical protein